MVLLRNLSTSVSEIFHSTHFIRTILTFPVQPVLVALYELTSLPHFLLVPGIFLSGSIFRMVVLSKRS